MQQPKISVILPVYNVEKYLSKCLEAVIRQDYPNIEIVVMDDGSTDQSLFIAREMLKNCPREHQIISRPNKGVSATRNDGIKAATGEWIVMIDADDVVEKDFVSVLHANISETEKKCAVFSNYRIVKHDNAQSPAPTTGQTRIFDRNTALKIFQTREIKFIVAAMLLNRQIIIEENIFFDEDCRYSEDVVYIWKILCRMNEIRFVDNQLYNYILHAGSTMTSSTIDKIMTSRKAILRLYSEYISRLEGMPELKQNFLCIYFLAIARSGARLLTYRQFKGLEKKLDLGSYFKAGVTDLGFKAKVLVIAFRINLRLFYTIIRK
jgi:glycosyltransferase involved in cell wall biosynthesis